MKNPIYLLISWILIVSACQPGDVADPPAPGPAFQGTRAAVELADRMFEAIGGKKGWAGLRALYIKAEHTEPQMSAPYQSEIWRGIDEFELRIVQGNDSFHSVARVSAQGGEVAHLDHRDTTRTLTAEQLEQWEFDHNHNVYVVLHRLARNPGAFRVALEETDRLTFYEEDQLLAAFRLDDKLRPYLFYQPQSDGKLVASEFDKWATHQGLVHSAGGGPLDGDFHYTTLAWEPSYRSFAETYSFADEACEAEQGMIFVCGPQNAEDLVWVEGTDWIIASGMSGEGFSGHMYLLDPAKRSYEDLYPGTSPEHRWDRDEFAACPGELDTANFSAHGLAIRALGDGMHRLYVTSHGAREAVEIFEVDAGGEKPTVAWVGCVVMPEHASINSVAPLADGGFVTTRIMSEGPEASADIFAGDVTGYLYEWHPGGAVSALAGTDMSGPNGIEVSPDGNTVFVASWGRGELARFGRGADGGLNHERTVTMNFRVDNLRWSKHGSLIAVGHRLSEQQDCGGPLCIDEWEVALVDPESMTTHTLAVKKSTDGFTGATVAIEADDGMWLGTFHGDRIAFLPRNAFIPGASIPGASMPNASR